MSIGSPKTKPAIDRIESSFQRFLPVPSFNLRLLASPSLLTNRSTISGRQ
jgi:hypothetical protein